MPTLATSFWGRCLTRRSLIRGPLLSLAIVLLTLVLAEVGLRVAGTRLGTPRLPLRYDPAAIDQLAGSRYYVTFDAQLGWVTTPGANRLSDGYWYRNNQQGLRAAAEYAPTPVPSIRRIAAYGDSYTYCYRSQLERCWTEVLATLLPATEVLNFGVPAYGPDQAWLRYQLGGADWRPCAVLIGHTVENINRVVNRFRPFYDPGTGIALAKPRYLLEEGRLVLLPSPARRAADLKNPRWVEANLGPHDDWYHPGVFVAQPLDQLQLGNLARTGLYKRERQQTAGWNPSRARRMYSPGNEAHEVLVAVLAEFATQVRADGATPVVLIFPHEGEIAAARDGRQKPHAALLEALENRGVATIDLSDALGAEARSAGLRALITNHYRRHGNEVVARTLAEQLPELTAPTCGRG